MTEYVVLQVTDHFAGFKGRVLAEPFTAVPSPGVDLDRVAAGAPLVVAKAMLPLMDYADLAELLAAVGEISVTPFPADDAVVPIGVPDPSEAVTAVMAGG